MKIKKEIPNLEKVFEWLQNEPLLFKIENDKALESFFGKKPEKKDFTNEALDLYIIYYLKFNFENNKNIVEKFIDGNKMILTEKEAKLYDNFKNGIYSGFEIIEINKGENMFVKDIFNPENTYKIEEALATEKLEVNQIFFTYIFKSLEDNEIFLSYGNLFSGGVYNKDEELFKVIKQEQKWTPKETFKLLNIAKELDKASISPVEMAEITYYEKNIPELKKSLQELLNSCKIKEDITSADKLENMFIANELIYNSPIINQIIDHNNKNKIEMNTTERILFLITVLNNVTISSGETKSPIQKYRDSFEK